jgi:hypothetical protein
MDKLEVRGIAYEDAEVRAIGDRAIEGYGIVFQKWSLDLGGFREIILPEAMEGVLDRSDVLALLNHDISRGILARYTKGKGSMGLRITETGVRYNFNAPKYSLGDEVLEGVERGDIRASSFAFTVAPGGEQWEKNEDGTWNRTIKAFDKIFDMSMVYSPAYTDTTVAKRSLDAIKEMSEPIKEEVKPPVTVEVPDEPIISFQRSAATDLEQAYRLYIDEYEINNLTR